MCPAGNYRKFLYVNNLTPAPVYSAKMSSVLIVDDSAEVRHIVRAFLERDAAFSVCGEAADGLEAIKKAQELKPNLVLLDLRMPKMNGIEAALVLRRVHPKIRIVLFSNYTDELGTSLASAVGIDLVLQKDSLAEMGKSLKALIETKPL
jgi:DNA-binding NarL/FixJ family response regulator